MGNASSSSGAGGPSLSDYQLPSYATAAVAERQPQDLFEDKLEAMFRFYLAQVQQRHASMHPTSPDAQVDWAAEAPISALPIALNESTIECFRGGTIMDLAQLFGVPLNAQLLPDSRSLGIVRRNVAALHPDHRRDRSADLYGPATVALEQLGQLVMRQADMFAGLMEHDAAYHLDDRIIPASLRLQPRPPPPSPAAADDAMDVAVADGDGYCGTEEKQGENGQPHVPQPPITPEEREVIRSVMRPLWGEHYMPTELEMQAVKINMVAGTLSLPGSAVGVPTDYDEDARERALASFDPAVIAASGMAQAVGQGAITSSALILPPKPVQPRFFQGHRIADRALVFAGDRSNGGTVSFAGGGITVGGGSGELVGTPLSVAYRPRAAHDLTQVVPLRPETGNADVADKFEQTLAYYNQPLALCQTRLMGPQIINSAHNEARGDLAAARGRGITSLRPGGGSGGTKRGAATPSLPSSSMPPAAGKRILEEEPNMDTCVYRLYDDDEASEEEEEDAVGGVNNKRRL